MSGPTIEAADRFLSLAEYEDLPEEDGYRLELSRGRLVREPAPGNRHAGIAAELIIRIGTHVRDHRLGSMLAPTGFLLGVDPPTVRIPDLAFLAAARLPAGGLEPGFWKGAPDLAVEILSPSNRATAIQEKVVEYLDAGAGLVWVVDPDSRTATVYRAGGEVRLLRGTDALEGGDVLPGFRLPLGELFDSI